MCHSVLVCVVMMLVLAARPAPQSMWVPVGAPGGNVRSLVSDPRDARRIYLGTADGLLYRSDDGAQHWRRMTPGFPLRGCSLDDIVVDPKGTVYVGYWEIHGQGGGVARSTDGGRTFTVLKGIDGESVRALALAPSNPRIVAAGTLSGIFLSKDGGRGWKRISPRGHPNLRNIESLAFDPRDTRVIYAGTWHLAWKTDDGGGAWQPVHRGMIDDSDVMTLSVDPRNTKTVYATACTGIYRSDDAAEQWTKIPGIPYSARRTRAFAQGFNDANVLLAGTTEGLWISEDSGGSWSRTTPKELVINSVVALPGGTILLGTEGAGVLRSSDRGETWVQSNSGFSERFVSKLLFDTAERRLIAVVWGAPQYGGVFVCEGVAGPWTRLGAGLDGRQVLTVALAGKTLLAGTDEGIYARERDAPSWTRVRLRVEEREIAPRVPELITLSPNRILAATSKGLIRSADGGLTWTQPKLEGADEVEGLAVPNDESQVVVAATGAGFYRSQDGGETWRQVSSSLGVTPHALAFVPSNDRILFTTTSGGLYRSTDQGATWRRVEGGIPHSDLTGIAVNPDGRTIYVSDFTWGGIFRSVDGGSTWDRMPTNGLGSDRVWTLSVDPTAPDRLLAAPSAGGLHLLVPASAARQAQAR